jgi:hypothetical protein
MFFSYFFKLCRDIKRKEIITVTERQQGL